MTARLLPRTRRWLLCNAVLATAIVNLALNAAIAWISTLGHSHVPLWATPVLGGPSMIPDTLATLFLLPLITSLLITAAIERDLRTGRLRTADAPHIRGLARLPGNPLRRAVALGATCLLIGAAPAIAGLEGLQLNTIMAQQFVLLKTSIAIALGLLVTPLAALAALSAAASRVGGNRP